MKIAIIGTRGVPNFYGGFEQFAEYFSLFLVGKGHEVYVYCPHNHPYRESSYKGVSLIRCFDPEYKVGTVGQFVYDFFCIRSARRLQPDVILNLGYTSSAIFLPLINKVIPVVTNMDGLEWKRSKYSWPVQKFIRFSEKLAVRYSDKLIADSQGIQDYLKKTYGVDSKFVAYGADVITMIPAEDSLDEFNLKPYEYDLIIARMEPENNIKTILEGFRMSKGKNRIVIIGNYNNAFGSRLFKMYGNNPRYVFVGPYYKSENLNALRYYSRVYFHGHSVGGTNPSLLEAMAGGAFICAHDNEFNRHVLQDSALYFKNEQDITNILDHLPGVQFRDKCIQENFDRIKKDYSWERINSLYEATLVNEIRGGK